MDKGFLWSVKEAEGLRRHSSANRQDLLFLKDVCEKQLCTENITKMHVSHTTKNLIQKWPLVCS